MKAEETVTLERSSNASTVNEGSASIQSSGNVFYNPVQQFNRDLSISVLTTYIEKYKSKNSKKSKSNIEDNGTSKVFKAGEKYEDGIRVLEALSATGLRSIRYAKEISGIKEIIANDLSKSAIKSIEENIKLNQVEHMVTPIQSDAMNLMYMSTDSSKSFDAIDLDPYGCPVRFLDAAVQSIKDGGILLVTATDMAVLAGNTPEACFVKYGSVPLRTKCCHEMALRILLRSIEAHANRYGRYIEPLLSISADFYIRVFVIIHSSQRMCKYSMSKQSMLYQCVGCDSLTLQPLGTLKTNENNPQHVKFCIPTGPTVGLLCKYCNNKHHLGGPIWSAAIHNKEFVGNLLDNLEKIEYLKNLNTHRRIIGMLNVINEELEDVPLYYAIDKMCSILKLEVIPTLKLRSALLHANYRVSFSHAYKNSIKTNAPVDVLWDILRCWEKIHPVKQNRLLEGTVIKTILQKKSNFDYNLSEIHPLANPNSRKNALSRFPENPAAHWGPGTRATLMIGEGKQVKSHKNQNKKQKAEKDKYQGDKRIKLI